MRIDRVEGSRFEASVAGSGNLDVAALHVEKANLASAGSGTLSARGSASQADLPLAGSGHVSARGLTSRTAAVNMAGSGGAELTTRGNAAVSIVGNGDVDIYGGARCTISRIGSGHAHCG